MPSARPRTEDTFNNIAEKPSADLKPRSTRATDEPNGFVSDAHSWRHILRPQKPPASDGLTEQFRVIEAEAASFHSDAHRAMAQRRSSSPFSSPSDPSESGFYERQQVPRSPVDDDDPLVHDSVADRLEATVSPTLTPDAASSLPKSQQQLHEYRARLARNLEIRELSAKGLLMAQSDRARVSPILEEDALSAPPPVLTGALTTTSTESGNTVRGGTTPSLLAHTPSYPFPRMAATLAANHMAKSLPTQAAPAGWRPPSSLPFESRGVHDTVLSDTPTPPSRTAFQPPSGSFQLHDTLDFATPNLYELSLMLSAEPGLEAWWNTVVQIMKDVFRAERVTLAVPADTSDVENVPWGQKASYNSHQEDEFSMGYMGKGSSIVLDGDRDHFDLSGQLDEVVTQGTPIRRPGLPSRHSFTTFEESKQPALAGTPALIPHKRPSNLTRSKTQYPSGRSAAELHDEYRRLNKDALDEHDAAEDAQQEIPSWEAPYMARYDGQGRILPVLQALDYEADPLIDHTGVMRVLERGRAVALTRTYPYLPKAEELLEKSSVKRSSSKASSADSTKRPKKQRSESISKLSSMLASTSVRSDKSKTIASCLEEDDPRPPTPKYEEYEQAPPSPWSQSPAPSPAVRSDTKENPFFMDAMVDEDSFNPGSPPESYTGIRPPEAIGVDNAWTVLHIPLTHLLLSKPTRTFKLDPSALEQKSQPRGKDEAQPGSKTAVPPEADRVTPEQLRRDKPSPIAILSVLSPIIPYPANLRHALEQLGPHMATSFSLCRHYSNLETELAGIQRRRPPTTGFGAVAPFASHVERGGAFLESNQGARPNSIGGSITSPSDYSAISKSTTASPMVTPGWEHGSIHQVFDRRQPAASPSGAAQTTGESYFSIKQKLASSRHDILSPAAQRSRNGSKDNSPGEKRHSFLSSVRWESEASSPNHSTDKSAQSGSEEVDASSKEGSASSSQVRPSAVTVQAASPQLTGKAGDSTAAEGATQPNHHAHTVLHSYGADFASTFQSLPPSSSLATLAPVQTSSAASRSGSVGTAAGDMPPPSDRLKGLILDSLPAHVFVSLPQTGETVWVNSRFLSYRGQTVADLSADPWGSIHPDDREGYLKAWGHSLRTGEQFSRTVRIKRFDGAYRWFYARAVASKDKRGVIMQFLGSYMDIHDQHIAELKAARQEEIEASEAKHRLLANLIPQIIFTATGDDGVTFANEQWLSYTGQSFDDSLGLGFMDHVHSEDLARCRFPITQRANVPAGSEGLQEEGQDNGNGGTSSSSTGTTPTARMGAKTQSSPGLAQPNSQRSQPPLSRESGSSGESGHALPAAELGELARKGIIKVTTDTSGRISYTTEVRLRSKTGEYRWHLIRCVEIDTIDFGRGASSYFGSATDINDHKLLEAKLKEAMESKGRFLSNMSHEIRTPLIGISGMVTFLQDTTLNEEQRDYTNTIQTSANSLIMIINDILDLSKVDAGMMKLKYEWFHTRSLIEDVNELVSTMAIAKRLELNYLVEADVPAWVKGDKVRIRQVLLNVIGNAIKFTTEGEVFSRCKVYTEGNQLGHQDKEIMLQFAITDTGRGFTKQEADLIFKPFSQIDGSSTRQHGGSGLGLVISRQLVELHGGIMEGTAIPGKGSTFTFTARFTLPSADDKPNIPASPGSTSSVSPQPDTSQSSDPSPGTVASSGNAHSPAGVAKREAKPDNASATAAAAPGISSGEDRGQIASLTSSSPSSTGLARFSEAAKASGQDLSQMRLEMPSNMGSPSRVATPDMKTPPRPMTDIRPPMYSILIICPQYHSREATTQHIEMTLPKDVPHQITAIGTVEEAQKFIGGDDPIHFTHIVLNLSSAEAIISVMDQITQSQKIDGTSIVVLSDSVQRQAVLKQATDTKYERLLSNSLVTFIYKPVKPSRFAVIFDPDKVRDLSTDRNRSTAQQMVESQKASYQEIERRMGNKGYRVLLVEDNLVNQKVLNKYLKKIGVEVEVAMDGVECTELVFAKPHSYYSLILVSRDHALTHCRAEPER